MTTLPEGITQSELNEYAKLDKAIKSALEKKAALNAKIKSVFVKKGIFIFGSVVIKLGEQNRFDRAAFEKAYPSEKYSQYYVMTPVVNETSIADKTVAKFTKSVQTLSISVAD